MRGICLKVSSDTLMKDWSSCYIIVNVWGNSSESYTCIIEKLSTSSYTSNTKINHQNFYIKLTVLNYSPQNLWLYSISKKWFCIVPTVKVTGILEYITAIVQRRSLVECTYLATLRHMQCVGPDKYSPRNMSTYSSSYDIYSETSK